MGKVIGVCDADRFSPADGYGQETILMLWIGIDTHLKTHEVEIQNENGKRMWKGRINNDRDGFESLLKKIRTVESSNSQKVTGIFMNPTGNYHMPVKHFLESNSFPVYVIDARRTEHLRIIQNLGKEKSDPEDAAVLASTARLDPSAMVSRGHERMPESGLTRMLEHLKMSATTITNIIASDLAAVFPEYTDIFDIEAKTSLKILERYATPVNIRNAGEDELFALMNTGKGHYSMDDARNLMHVAETSIGIPDPGDVYAYRIRMNALRLREEKDRIRQLEAEINSRMSENTDVKNISDIHGVSATSAAAIVSEIGDIKQFDSAVRIQAYGGKTPDMTGSGGKSWAKGTSKIRNPHLSNSVYECAVSLVLHKNPEFLAVYQREIDKKKKPTQAYIVVGKRLLYHIYSIMKNRKPYRERMPRGRDGNNSTGTV